LNLALNARDAMRIGGVVLIEARNVKASDKDKPAGLAPGDYVADPQASQLVWLIPATVIPRRV
jgi:hypothetical protein